VTILVVGVIDDPMLSRGSRVTLKTFFSFSKSGWGIRRSWILFASTISFHPHGSIYKNITCGNAEWLSYLLARSLNQE
jgi:hypothetical protein